LYGLELRRGTEDLDLAYRVEIEKGSRIPGFFGCTAGEEDKDGPKENPSYILGG
jgi:hypothetical protein